MYAILPLLVLSKYLLGTSFRLVYNPLTDTSLPNVVSAENLRELVTEIVSGSEGGPVSPVTPCLGCTCFFDRLTLNRALYADVKHISISTE
jgi:hypothetical protein